MGYTTGRSTSVTYTSRVIKTPHRAAARLRVALATPHADARLPRWAGQMVENIAASEVAFLALVLNGAAAEASPSGRAYRLYNRTLGRVPRGLVDPLEIGDYTGLLAGVPNAPATPEALRERDIDVLVAIGCGKAVAHAAAGTRYGVWYLQPGEERYRGGPALFWEALEGTPVSAMSVVAHLPDEPQAFVLDTAYFSTERDIYAAMNRIAPYWGGAALLLELLQQLHSSGMAAIGARMQPLKVTRSPRRDPGLLDLLRWIVPPATRKVLRRLRGTPDLVQEWRVAIRRGGDLLRNEPEQHMAGFHFLDAPAGHFYADPFPIEDARTCWLFFEDYVCADRKAVLSCGELTSDGRLQNVNVILDRPYHLSYPLVFQHQGCWYMMPESNANGTVDLYIAERFPYAWRFEKTLFRGKAVDTAVWVGNGVFWFFVTLIEPLGRGMTLRLFSSESLTGTWKPHPANPISRDVRNARGAGAIFRRHGKLYRPSQDCSWRYGYGFALNEILALTPEKYEEKQVIVVGPNWAPSLHGTHTYNRAGDMEAVDAGWFVPKSKHLSTG
jgi:hypothetical protein